MIRRAWVLPFLCALAACDDPEEPPVEPADEDGVIRDCEPGQGRICPWAGTGDNGWNGDGRPALETMFSFPMSVTLSALGPPMVADWNNHKIRELTAEGTFLTRMGTDFLGDGDPSLLDATSFGAPGTEVNLNHPTMQAYDSTGLLLSASWHTHKIRTLDLDSGLVHVELGSLPGMAPLEPAEDRGAAVLDDGCRMNQPKAIAIDGDDNVYVLDMRNERIRFWDRRADTIRTIAGTGGKANALEYTDPANPDRIDAEAKCLDGPKNGNPEPGGDLVLSADGETLYVADPESHVIREIDLVSGTISTLAGAFLTPGFADGSATEARFDFPTDLALEGGTLFVADANNHRIRAVDVNTGAVVTVAGNGQPSCTSEDGGVAIDSELTVLPGLCDEQKRSGDGGDALDAQLYRPMGVDLDADGNLVIADTYNHRFRVVYR
jgi:DNA-binding beta-propeller fold protein YncE